MENKNKKTKHTSRKVQCNVACILFGPYITKDTEAFSNLKLQWSVFLSDQITVCIERDFFFTLGNFTVLVQSHGSHQPCFSGLLLFLPNNYRNPLPSTVWQSNLTTSWCTWWSLLLLKSQILFSKKEERDMGSNEYTPCLLDI